MLGRTDSRRRTLLVLANLAAIGLALLLSGAASFGALPLWAILLAALAFGTFDAGKIASAQAYTYDLVGPLLATSGIAIAATQPPFGASSAKVATSGKTISTSSARTRGAVNSQLHHAPFGERLNSK